MRVPGFNAESSLKKASRHYHATFGYANDFSALQPSQLYGDDSWEYDATDWDENGFEEDEEIGFFEEGSW